MTLELKGVSLSVEGETHIYPTDLELVEGEFNILLGTTLAGKTSLMRLMAGLERPSTGQIWFNGSNVTGMSVQKRDVAMVYQQFINYPNFTVYQNIASPMRLRGMSKKAIRESVNQVAELLQLTPMLDRLPNELSGGQQQRVAIARALANEPDVIVADEPTGSLDSSTGAEIMKLFVDLHDLGKTIVMVTHEQEIARYASRAVMLRDGEIEKDLVQL